MRSALVLFIIIVMLVAVPSIVAIVLNLIWPEPKNYEEDAGALVGVNHPTNRLTLNSRQVS